MNPLTNSIITKTKKENQTKPKQQQQQQQNNSNEKKQNKTCAYSMKCDWHWTLGF